MRTPYHEPKNPEELLDDGYTVAVETSKLETLWTVLNEKDPVIIRMNRLDVYNIFIH